MAPDEKIELRSEKVRSIIGQIPSRIVRFGTGILSIVILLFFIGGYVFKYPIQLNIPVVINSAPEAISMIADDEGTICYLHKSEQKLHKGDSIAMLSTLSADLHTKTQFIFSPIDGKLLQNYKSGNWLSKNSIICAIIPDSIESYYIQALIPHKYFSAVRIGQIVHVELNGYPYSDYGFLKGLIDYISPISLDQKGRTYFNVNIDLPCKMITTLHKSIEYTPGMKGNASIILSEEPLIKRLISTSR
jgi:hypothetical protein